jgi:hypothetical protein
MILMAAQKEKSQMKTYKVYRSVKAIAHEYVYVEANSQPEALAYAKKHEPSMPWVEELPLEGNSTKIYEAQVIKTMKP